MDPLLIHLNDIYRILFGEAPASFLVEVLIRIFSLVVIVLVAMRLMGKRMSSQLSIQEMAVLVSLAGAIGIPMQTPDRGILPAAIIAVIALSLQRAIAFYAYRNAKAEAVTQGGAEMLIANGVLQLDLLKSIGLSRDTVFAQLRSEDIRNLSSVKRFYMESNGNFTLIPAEKKEQPGLSIIPLLDEAMIARQQKSHEHNSCTSCGFTYYSVHTFHQTCPACDSKKWTQAVI
jgi:uncharacterized membrane protein YcaP (DUF421 family)